MSARAFRSFLSALVLLVVSSAAKGSAPPDRVLLTVVGTARDLDRVRSAFALDASQEVTLEWLLRPRWDARELLSHALPESAVVACWVDLSEPGRAKLYFVHRARARFLFREVPLEGGLNELGRETLAQVLEMSVRALQEDEYAGMSREDAARALGDPATPQGTAGPPAGASQPARRPGLRTAETPSAPSLLLAPFYALRTYSSEAAFVHGPGLALGWVGSSAHWRTRVWATAQYELPRTVSKRWVGLEWSTVALRGVFVLNRQLGDTVELGARAGIGVNVVRIAPTHGTGDGAVLLASSRSAAELVLELGLESCAALSARVASCARLFTDVHPERLYYGLETSHGVERVFAPWSVRPGVAVSLLLR